MLDSLELELHLAVSNSGWLLELNLSLLAEQPVLLTADHLFRFSFSINSDSSSNLTPP